MPGAGTIWLLRKVFFRLASPVSSLPSRKLGESNCPSDCTTAAEGGGYWLTCFTGRTQLVEFVLRENAYRRRMMAEIALTLIARQSDITGTVPTAGKTLTHAGTTFRVLAVGKTAGGSSYEFDLGNANR